MNTVGVRRASGFTAAGGLPELIGVYRLDSGERRRSARQRTLERDAKWAPRVFRRWGAATVRWTSQVLKRCSSAILQVMQRSGRIRTNALATEVHLSAFPCRRGVIPEGAR
jgi:hypothetical protein